MTAAVGVGIPGVDFPRQTGGNTKDIFDYISDWTEMTGGIKNLVVKPALLVFSYLDLLGYEKGSRATGVQKALGEGKKFLGVVELPKKINSLRHEIVKFNSKKPVRSLWEIAMKANELVSPVWDGVELLQSRGITHIPSTAMQVGNGVSSVSLLVGMSNTAVKSVYHIGKQLNIIAHSDITNAPDDRAESLARREVVDAAKITSKKVQDLISAVAYIAIAIFSLAVLISVAAVALGLIAAPLVIPAAIMVSLTTVTVFIGITGYFTNKMLDIENLEKTQARRIAMQRAVVAHGEAAVVA